MRVLWKRSVRIFVLIAFVFGSTLPLFYASTASAAQITERSLTLQAGTEDGGSMPGGEVNHVFNFIVPTAGNIGSIAFQYCEIASGVCDTPVGLDTTTATLGSESGATGFSVVNTTQGTPYVTRAASSITANTEITIALNNITNPSAANETFFVRIATYASVDTTGTPIDEGTVAASTASEITLSGVMPESLIFCTGATIDMTAGIPDCSTATSGIISFDQLFSPLDTAVATSQMAASTNATYGYSITVNGPTLQSGGNQIAPMAAPAVSTQGIAQFGMNLATNLNPEVGADIVPVSNGTDLRAQPTADYATPDNFKFASGDSVANSAFNTPGPTNSQIYTASYIVNVPGSQPAGTYTSTLTYICTPTF